MCVSVKSVLLNALLHEIWKDHPHILTQDDRLALPAEPRSADGTILTDIPLETNASSRMSAGNQGVVAPTLVNVAPHTGPELLRAQTPLRHSQFERELEHHPDKAWVSWLLRGIN